MMKPFIFITLILCAVSVFAGDSKSLPLPEGTFIGKVYNNFKEDPVSTHFFLDKQGALRGKYTIKEGRKSVKGTLKNIKSESDYVFFMVWEDAYGEGTLRLLFAEDYESFTGYWGDSETSNSLPWNGTKN